MASNTYAQSIPYAKVISIFNTWKTTNATSVKSTSSQLKAISPKWSLESTKPTVEDETKYYLWKAPEGSANTQYFALYIEEDATTVKYSLKYIFYNKASYQAYLTSLKGSNPEKINTFEDRSKNEFTTTAEKAKINYFLKEFLMDGTKAYSIDIETKYINK